MARRGKPASRKTARKATRRKRSRTGSASRLRTAVLVVHGMGTQRPLETLRGVIKAVWLTRGNKIWVHPERSGTDIDLPVITSSEIPGHKQKHRVDFHELYWSHLMSETRALAVLLWLLELARKGPRFSARMNELWWAGAIFIQLLIFSVALLVIQAIGKFGDFAASAVTQSSRPPDLGDLAASMIQSWPPDLTTTLPLAPVMMFLILAALSTVVALAKRNWRLAWWSAVSAGLLGAVLASAVILSFFYGILTNSDGSALVGTFLPSPVALVGTFLPSAIALVASWFLMGFRWGSVIFALTYALSIVYEVLFVWMASVSLQFVWPWAVHSSLCTAAAVVIIGTYLVVNAAFLQPYLGDAARYFRDAPSNVAVRREIRRQAVNTLEALHLCGKYDRIVVVAHSLGSVVAYDMLRAYFGRIFRHLPDPNSLGKPLDDIEELKLTKGQLSPADVESLREKGREIIKRIAKAVTVRRRIMSEQALARDSEEGAKTWLVTDFVTVGSPLTHGVYLIMRGNNGDLRAEFEQRVSEREFPTCPPRILSKDRRLTYTNNKRCRFHHGAVFGLTRWTNLYFPMQQVFWGDAIGGPVGFIFGEGVFDVPVHTRQPGAAEFFTHTAYWEARSGGGKNEPHIQALCAAMDLADDGIPNKRRNFPVDPAL